jgi:hypothetical protein
LVPLLNRQVDDRPRIVTIFGAVISSRDLEFLQRTRIDVDEVIAASAVFLVIHAIQVPAEGIGPAAVRRLAAIVYPVSAEEAETAQVSSRNSRDQFQQLREVPPVVLNLRGLLSGNQAANFSGGRFHLGHVSLYGHRLSHVADFQPGIHRHLGVNNQLHALER